MSDSCDLCFMKEDIISCRKCCAYNGNTKLPNLFVGLDNKRDFFKAEELPDKLILLVKSKENKETRVNRISISYGQAHVLQRFLYEIVKHKNENSKVKINGKL